MSTDGTEVGVVVRPLPRQLSSLLNDDFLLRHIISFVPATTDQDLTFLQATLALVSKKWFQTVALAMELRLMFLNRRIDHLLLRKRHCAARISRVARRRRIAIKKGAREAVALGEVIAEIATSVRTIDAETTTMSLLMARVGAYYTLNTAVREVYASREAQNAQEQAKEDGQAYSATVARINQLWRVIRSTPDTPRADAVAAARQERQALNALNAEFRVYRFVEWGFPEVDIGFLAPKIVLDRHAGVQTLPLYGTPRTPFPLTWSQFTYSLTQTRDTTVLRAIRHCIAGTALARTIYGEKLSLRIRDLETAHDRTSKGGGGGDGGGGCE